MSSPTKTRRRLPVFPGSSIPAHSQSPDTGLRSTKDTPQKRQTESSLRQPEDVAEKFSSTPQGGDVVSNAINRGTKSPVENYSRVMEGVIFTISGLVNPERTELRKMALDMSAQYRPTWSDDSTLLVCPFPNTPTFKQVQASGGTIVHKDWIAKCYEQKKLVAIEMYMLNVGKPWKTGNNDDDASDVGVANDFPAPKSLKTEQQKSAVKGRNPECQANNSARKLSMMQNNNPGAAGPQKRTESVPKNLPSPVDVQQWVLEDLAATLTWLEQQNDKPEQQELEVVAAQGLLVCLDDAVKSLQENKGLSMVMDNWAFIPRAVKELAVYEKNGQCMKDQLISEGERFKVIYESQLKKLGFCVPTAHDDRSRAAKTGRDGNHSLADSLQPGIGEETEKDFDDDATEIISDSDSRDPADFDTDDTEELDEIEISQCKEIIMQKFRLV